MTSLDHDILEISCPGCGKKIECTYYDLYSRKLAKCHYCGSFYKISLNAASRFRSAMINLEQSQKKFMEARNHLFNDAEILIKKR
jgi:uncharacterized Zn finger protein